MADWNRWRGKKVFIRTKNDGHPFSGRVVEISDIGEGHIFISIIDKHKRFVTFTVSEILSIKEEDY